MSSARALANQKLYHAKILIRSWRAAQKDEEVPVTVLAQVFGVAVVECLKSAYGWFLLEIVQPAKLPVLPPRSCDDLPDSAEGTEIAPEIIEFRRLECEGWLTELLGFNMAVNERRNMHVRVPEVQNLAVQSEKSLQPEDTEKWIDQLNQLFERMSNSLEEY